MENTIIIIIVSVLFSAFFSGIEIAFISSNKLKIELDRKNRRFSGRVLSGFNKNPSDFITTMLLGNTISLVIYGSAMAKLMLPWLENHLPGSLNSGFAIMIIQTILSTLMILFVAEFTPKTLFRANPNQILRFLILPVFLIYYILYPIQFIFVEISEFILEKIFRVKFYKNEYAFSYADLYYYVQEYELTGKEDENRQPEIQMFQNAIDFNSIRIKECVVPRNEIEALEESESVEILLEKFIETQHSKILIYKNNIDNIIGYVHSFDIFNNPMNIRQIIKPILIIPQTLLAKDLLRMFITQHRSVAVVVDEFGGTSGMVTMEDIIEEITGEIDDEYDVEDLVEKQCGENEFVFSGRIEIDYLNDKYKLNIPKSDEYETLAGFIIHHLERIPMNREKFSVPPFDITILQASRNKIEQVNLKLSEDD